MINQFPQNIQAILFDMDGVLLDSERVWRKYTPQFWTDCGVKELPQIVSEQVYGISMSEEYEIVQKHIGISMTLEEYVAAYDKYSLRVYTEARIALDLEKTLTNLKSRGLKLAIVTSSLGSWVNLFTNRLSKSDYFDIKLSIADTSGLNPKPSPAGYLHALEKLGIKAENAIAVEDSNRGIKSARAASLFTVASSEFIDSTYDQAGYDSQILFLKNLLV